MVAEESQTLLDNSDQEEKSKCSIKARHVLALMAFLAQFTLFSLRTNLSNKSSASFTWTSAQQGLLLGSYYYGYLFTNVPGAWIANIIGFKKVLFVSMFTSSILTILTPAAAYASFGLVVATRVVLGFFQGLTSPVLQGALAGWTPPRERSTVFSINFAGSVLGICVVLPLAGVISDSLGWEAVYYVTGVGALIWSLASLILIYDSPSLHPRISLEEKSYILASVNHPSGHEKKAPWCKMLTSPAALGIHVGLFCGNWGDLFVLTYLPMYMSKYLGFDLSTAGTLSSFPFVLKLAFTIGGGYATDLLLHRQLLSTVAVRKINTTVGLVLPGLFLVLAGYVGCNVGAAVSFFAASVAFSAFTAPGYKTNAVDIAPAYAGILFGIANTVGTIPGFLSAQIAGAVLQDERSLTQWQTIFWICASVQLIGAGFYLAVGSAKEQSWAKAKAQPEENAG